MQKNTQKSVSALRHTRTATGLAVCLLIVACSAFPGAQHVSAAPVCNTTTDCQAKINSTNNVINNGQQQLSSLAGQATNYQGAISGLQSQISGLQSDITNNRTQQGVLQQQIAAAQTQLTQKKDVLSATLRAMYIDGQISTIEMLATSNNLSDYVDKAADRQQIQVSVQDSITSISTLQADLNSKKANIDTLLANQQSQQSQLSGAREQQSSLLSYNQSQQAAYNQQVASSKTNLSSLKARLAALNTTANSVINISGTCGGGYPASANNNSGGHWGCNYTQDNTVDNWNMLNRECVSYTAYMAYKQFGVSTSKWGSAYLWINAARSRGFRVDQTPSAGAIAIRDRNYSESGDVGHAMYVVSARGAHDITVNEYNRHYDGTYDQRTFDPTTYSAPVYYIHF